MQRYAVTKGAAVLSVLCGLATPAPADDGFLVVAGRPSPFAVSFGAAPQPANAGGPFAPAVAARGLFNAPADLDRDPAGSTVSDDGQGRPMAVVYSDGYNRRRKIHYIASFATIPLFATQYALGRKLYDGTGSSGTRSAHRAVAIGVGALFGVNTVTGVWNLVEGRKDPNGRAKRLVHGILMLTADAGFVATAALAPRRNGSGDRVAHRAVALTSVALATTGYLMMLFGR